MTLTKKTDAEIIETFCLVLFWLAPIIDAVLAGIVYCWFESEE